MSVNKNSEHPLVSEDIQLLRRSYLEQAAHSSRMEGQESSLEFKADAELWVVGEITLDELLERTMCRIKGCEH